MMMAITIIMMMETTEITETMAMAMTMDMTVDTENLMHMMT